MCAPLYPHTQKREKALARTLTTDLDGSDFCRTHNSPCQQAACVCLKHEEAKTKVSLLSFSADLQVRLYVSVPAKVPSNPTIPMQTLWPNILESPLDHSRKMPSTLCNRSATSYQTGFRSSHRGLTCRTIEQSSSTRSMIHTKPH